MLGGPSVPIILLDDNTVSVLSYSGSESTNYEFSSNILDLASTGTGILILLENGELYKLGNNWGNPRVYYTTPTLINPD